MLMLSAKITGNPLNKGYKTVFEEDFSCWQGVYAVQTPYFSRLLTAFTR